MADTESSLSVTTGTGTLVGTVVRGGKHLQKWVPAGIGGAVKGQAITVTDVATPIPTTNLTLRGTWVVRNYDTTLTNAIFLGASNVTTASGFPLLPLETLPIDLSDGAQMYAIAGTGVSVPVRLLEIATGTT